MEEFACLAGVAFAGSKGGVPPVLSGRDGRVEGLEDSKLGRCQPAQHSSGHPLPCSSPIGGYIVFEPSPERVKQGRSPCRRDVFRGGIGFQPMIGGVHRQDADATRFRRQKI